LTIVVGDETADGDACGNGGKGEQHQDRQRTHGLLLRRPKS
jgi:hypothetical protein